MNQQSYDFLVIGSGIAGLSYALKMAETGSVAIITKKHSAESNTNYAQGGIAVVMDGVTDSFERHIEDTLICGAGICDKDIVRIVVEEGPARVQELVALGAKFTKKGKKLDLGREGGHSANRIVHAADMTGREIERSLLQQVQENPNISIMEYHYCLDLLLTTEGECAGVWVVNEETGEVSALTAHSTLLASGGSGQVYQHTSNPAIATGDGVAMAYRAGAKVANMEFFQFHPTCLYHPEASSFLISEAVRGDGCLLFINGG
jgi:L-aspartate oxidase